MDQKELKRFNKYFKWYKIEVVKSGLFWERVWSKKKKKFVRKLVMREGKTKTYAYFWNVVVITSNPKWKPVKDEWVTNPHRHPFGRQIWMIKRKDLKEHEERRKNEHRTNVRIKHSSSKSRRKKN